MERLLIKITKTDEAKFISHLDTMRTFHRALRRASLPVSYSKGFNPHPSISVAAPLSLGVASIGEYIDVDFDNFVDEKEVKEKLNESLPLGMRVLNVQYIKEKRLAAMAAVEGAKYTVRMEHRVKSKENCENYISSILSSKEIIKAKKTKKGIRDVDVRPLIIDLKLAEFNNEELEIEAFVKAGSNGSLSMEILSSILKDFSCGDMYGFPHAKRTNIYAKASDKWVDLLTYYK